MSRIFGDPPMSSAAPKSVTSPLICDAVITVSTEWFLEVFPPRKSAVPQTAAAASARTKTMRWRGYDSRGETVASALTSFRLYQPS